MKSKRSKIILAALWLGAVIFAISIYYNPVSDNGTNLALAAETGNDYPTLNKENTLYIKLRTGLVKIQLLPDVAPNHVKRIKTLAQQGFYDGIIFHRVIDGFMAQTGDPTGTGGGGSDLPDVAAEFTNKYSFSRGVIGMARSNHPDSANSQFFIMFDNGTFLNGKYSILGRVVDGMDAIDRLAKGEPPANPDNMQKVYLEQ